MAAIIVPAGMSGGAYQVVGLVASGGGGNSLAGTAQAITWNPSDIGVNGVLANSNRDFTGSGVTNPFTSCRGTLSSTSGLKYIEFKLTSVTGTNANVGIGFANAGASLTTYLSNSLDGCMIYWGTNGDFVSANITKTNAIAPGTSVTNDIYGLAINTTSGKGWFHKNGTYFNSGNPAAGTNPWVTFVTSQAWFPAGTQNNGSPFATLNIPATTAFDAPSGFTVF